MSGPDFDAIIFDCDGTLVDSERLSIRVLVDYIAELGLILPYETAVEEYSGNDLAMVFRDIEQKLGRSLPTDFMERFRERQLRLLATNLLPMPGAADLLSVINRPMCVASNAPLDKIELCLSTAGLNQFFEPDRVFSAYEIQIWKPAPDLFHLAAQRMGVAPERCAVVEDSRFGIEAGLAAGMQVFACVHEELIGVDLSSITRVRQLSELIPLLTAPTHI